MIQGSFRGGRLWVALGLARFLAAANARPSHAAAPESLAPRSVLKKIGERGRRAGLAARRSHRRRRLAAAARRRRRRRRRPDLTPPASQPPPFPQPRLRLARP